MNRRIFTGLALIAPFCTPKVALAKSSLSTMMNEYWDVKAEIDRLVALDVYTEAEFDVLINRQCDLAREISNAKAENMDDLRAQFMVFKHDSKDFMDEWQTRFVANLSAGFETLNL